MSRWEGDFLALNSVSQDTLQSSHWNASSNKINVLDGLGYGSRPHSKKHLWAKSSFQQIKIGETTRNTGELSVSGAGKAQISSHLGLIVITVL